MFKKTAGYAMHLTSLVWNKRYSVSWATILIHRLQTSSIKPIPEKKGIFQILSYTDKINNIQVSYSLNEIEMFFRYSHPCNIHRLLTFSYIFFFNCKLNLVFRFKRTAVGSLCNHIEKFVKIRVEMKTVPVPCNQWNLYPSFADLVHWNGSDCEHGTEKWIETQKKKQAQSMWNIFDLIALKRRNNNKHINDV